MTRLSTIGEVGHDVARMAEQLERTGEQVRATLLTSGEIAAAAVNYPARTPLAPRVGDQFGGIRVAFGAVTGRCTSIDAEGEDTIRFAIETEPGLPAGGVASGVAAHEISIAWTGDDERGRRYSVFAMAPKRNFEDSAACRDIVERVLARVAFEMIERDLTVGDGVRDATDERLLGLFIDPDVPTTTGTATIADVEKAIEGVIDAGFAVTEDDPLDFVCGTEFWSGLVADADDKSVIEALNGFVRPIVTPFGPDDEAIVGRLATGVQLGWSEGLHVDLSNSHASAFLDRLICAVLEVHVEAKVVVPRALLKLEEPTS